MNKQRLLELRKEINDTLMPLVLDGEGNAEERAQLLLNVIRLGSQDEAVFNKALETIQAIEDKEQKSSLLFELLSEVEVELQAIDGAEAEGASPTAVDAVNDQPQAPQE